MANQAASILAPFWHEPEGADGLKFRVRGLTGIQIFDVNAHSVRNGDSISWTSAGIRAALKFGLLDWEGFKDSDGNDVAFGKDAEKNIARLDFMMANELFSVILGASNLGNEVAKN